MDKFKEYLPFNDPKSFVRVFVGVVLVLMVLKWTGLRRFTA